MSKTARDNSTDLENKWQRYNNNNNNMRFDYIACNIIMILSCGFALQLLSCPIVNVLATTIDFANEVKNVPAILIIDSCSNIRCTKTLL